MHGNVHVSVRRGGLVLLSNQDPASYPTLSVKIALTGLKHEPSAQIRGQTRCSVCVRCFVTLIAHKCSPFACSTSTASMVRADS